MTALSYMYEKDEVLKKIVNADVIISDFDGTDVKSPLKNAAISFCSKPHNLIKNPKLFPWGIEAALTRILVGKDSESRLWTKFSEIIEQDLPTLVSDVKENLGSKRTFDDYFLPGVKDFYSLLPNSEKYYASRNFQEILEIFATEVSIPGENIYSELKNKSNALEDILEKRKLRGSFGGIYVLKGDSKSDDEILEIADFYKRKDFIDDYVGIAVGKSVHSSNKNVDIVSSPDQSKLVEDIRNYLINNPV